VDDAVQHDSGPEIAARKKVDASERQADDANGNRADETLVDMQTAKYCRLHRDRGDDAPAVTREQLQKTAQQEAPEQHFLSEGGGPPGHRHDPVEVFQQTTVEMEGAGGIRYWQMAQR